MKSFATRLRAYLKENNISQSRFAKTISQDSNHNFKYTLRKVQRWVKENKPRLSSYEGALAFKIIQDWEQAQGRPPRKSGENTAGKSEDEKNYLLDVNRKGIESLSFFERREIINTFCNSGQAFSSLLNPLQ